MTFRRTQFTEEDEERLCKWIATKIPYKETGGRTGNRLYQQLCEMVMDSFPIPRVYVYAEPIPSLLIPNTPG